MVSVRIYCSITLILFKDVLHGLFNSDVKHPSLGILTELQQNDMLAFKCIIK